MAEVNGKALKIAKEEITVGTWNVRTLHAKGMINELVYELEKYLWNVVVLAEASRSGFGEITTDEGHKIW